MLMQKQFEHVCDSLDLSDDERAFAEIIWIKCELHSIGRSTLVPKLFSPINDVKNGVKKNVKD